MEEPTEKPPAVGISPPEPKRQRRCVQSKLSWHKPRVEEEKKEEEEEKKEEEEEEEKEEGGESDQCDGKARRKRKSQPKTPTKSPAKSKELRRTSTRNKSTSKLTGENTPRKAQTSRDSDQNELCVKKRLTYRNSDAKKDVDNQNISVHHPMPDLLLEAKTAAEENVRLSAGKQTHPFFTSRKVAKRLPETQEKAKSHSIYWHDLDEDCFLLCPPLHVFDKLGDGIASIDWRNWAFIETTEVDLNDCCTIGNTSTVFKDFVKPLKLDAVSHNTMHLEQLSDKSEGYVSAANSSSIFSDGQDTNGQQLTSLEMVHARSKITLSSRCFSYVDCFESHPQDRLLKERLTSYHERISCWPECSLWTDKYQPENALEVCGNSESIKSLSEWLKSWHERGSQTITKRNILEQYAFKDAEESGDSTYANESDMDDLEDADTLKNVLLLTGPVGSGKSAAIYACAKEQGFEVIEVNASDLRGGAHIKQKIGEAAESHRLNQWSVEDPNGPRRKQILELLAGPADIREEEFGNGSPEMVSMTRKQDATPTKSPCKARASRSDPCQAANKTLILFEDVDTVFDEDRGFISSILQLAETSKRPIILTSNNRNPVLPQLLEQFVLNFTLPSYDELLCHLYMICASEKAYVSSELLAHLVSSCMGDIRKILMLLQFWCQGKNLNIGMTSQGNYGSLPFVIDTAHLVMPRIIPWGLPCKLSEKVRNEIDKILPLVEENLHNMEMVTMETIDLPKRENSVATPVKARKKALLKRNHTFLDSAEVSDNTNGLDDFSADLDSLENHVCQKVQHKVKHRPGIVLSSQSDEESTDCVPHSDAMKDYQISDMVTAPISQTAEVLDFFGSPTDPIHRYKMDNANRCPSGTFEAVSASASHICDTFKSMDVSCVPESSYVSGTKTKAEDDYLVISSKNTSLSLSDFISSPINVLAGGEINTADRISIDLNRCLEENDENTCDVDVESVSGNEEVGYSQNKVEEPRSCRYQLMDECSQAEFSMRLAIGKNCEHLPEFDLVQETWRKLRCCRDDLRSFLPANIEDVSSTMKLASGLTDLISEADIMFGCCYPLFHDMLDPSITHCVEPDDFSWYEEQYEIGSTYAQHGLCFYSVKCAAIGSSLGHENTVDLAQEMLSSSTNTMALGKLLSKGKNAPNSYLGNSNILKSGCGTLKERQMRSALDDVILPTVPARLSTALKGHAFHEYSSFMSKISRLECSRLSQSIQPRKRRVRRHYLSSGPLSLSPEHVELLARSGSFKG
ncbi:Uncharacterized protein M6B38_212620 [Iris pallida]|uniref:AAA+ ATPase domain-containing protein n=1 Tax=Iris pallida TaxID=29817 RepID=A0AAX6E4N4_IRIPA|nr:Uncharacterized protein M6B38_212620 [Iris pallida]